MQQNQTETQQVAAALLTYMNQAKILPVDIVLERTETRPAAVMTLREGPVYHSQDLTGGYTAEFPFAVSYCLTPENQEQRLLAIDQLCQLGQWLETFDPETDSLPLQQGQKALGFQWESFPVQVQTEGQEEQYLSKFKFIYIQEAE